MGTVAIQRGHCFRTRGSTGGPYEQETANAVAQLAKPLIEAAGHRAILLTADEAVPRTDVFIALHCDASGSSAAVGASVGYQDDRGRRLAYAWKAAYCLNGWNRSWQADNYTVNLARYYGVRQALAVGTTWACIVEHGFTTNATERDILRSVEGRRMAALALRDAVVTVIGGTVDNREPSMADIEAYWWPREGDAHERVRLIQRKLQEAFGRSALKADSDWGPKTTAVVERIHPEAADRWTSIHEVRVDRVILARKLQEAVRAPDDVIEAAVQRALDQAI